MQLDLGLSGVPTRRCAPNSTLRQRKLGSTCLAKHGTLTLFRHCGVPGHHSTAIRKPCPQSMLPASIMETELPAITPAAGSLVNLLVTCGCMFLGAYGCGVLPFIMPQSSARVEMVGVRRALPEPERRCLLNFAPIHLTPCWSR